VENINYSELSQRIENINTLLTKEIAKQDALKLQAESILARYNVSSLEELQALYDAKAKEIQELAIQANEYVSKASEYLTKLDTLNQRG